MDPDAVTQAPFCQEHRHTLLNIKLHQYMWLPNTAALYNLLHALATRHRPHSFCFKLIRTSKSVFIRDTPF